MGRRLLVERRHRNVFLDRPPAAAHCHSPDAGAGATDALPLSDADDGLPGDDTMKEVRIYTARYCPYCASAKSLLKRKGVSFTEIDIGGNWERRDEMIERANGRVTVPQVFIGDLHVGGHEELQTIDREGKLDQLLRNDTAG